MANGIEDLREKNRDRAPVDTVHYRDWSRFQGREDAEMLQEKASDWSAVKNDRGDYDRYDRDDY